MQRIQEQATLLRSLVNEPGLFERRFDDSRDDWNCMCVALDTLEDAALALNYFEERGLGSRSEERYIRLYGVLQAVVLQQDAIRAIHKVIVGLELDSPEGSAWRQLRDLRNKVASHPIECGDLRIFLSRVTITDQGFKLLRFSKSHPEQQPVTESVGFLDLYDGYREEAATFLEQIAISLAGLADELVTK